MAKRFLVCLLFSFVLLPSFGQIKNADSVIFKKLKDVGNYLWNRHHDSTYIQDYTDLVALRLVVNNRVNFFRLVDREQESSIGYRPEIGLNLGLGVTYEWFNIDITFDLGLEEEKVQNDYFFDIQFALMGSRLYADFILQYYKGYQNSFTSGLETGDRELPVREDLRTIAIGIESFYAFNYSKFSIKAPFSLNEVQRKSAGSFVVGLSFFSYSMDADSSIVPQEVQTNFNPALHLQNINSLNFAINGGYMHTFVVGKHFYFTFSLIPGLNLNFGDYRVDKLEPLGINASFKIKTLNSIGVSGKRWFGGVQFFGDLVRFRPADKAFYLTGNGKGKLFVGYRFGNPKRVAPKERAF